MTGGPFYIQDFRLAARQGVEDLSQAKPLCISLCVPRNLPAHLPPHTSTHSRSPAARGLASPLLFANPYAIERALLLP